MEPGNGGPDSVRVYYSALEADSRGRPPDHPKYESREKSGLQIIAKQGNKVGLVSVCSSVRVCLCACVCACFCLRTVCMCACACSYLSTYNDNQIRRREKMNYATVTNKTDIVRFQRFAHHRRI